MGAAADRIKRRVLDSRPVAQGEFSAKGGIKPQKLKIVLDSILLPQPPTCSTAELVKRSLALCFQHSLLRLFQVLDSSGFEDITIVGSPWK
jgi:hypothetical protein